MFADRTDEHAALAGAGRPSAALRRLLSTYGTVVERVRAAESRYRGVVPGGSQSQIGGRAGIAGSGAKRASAKTVNIAFDALAEAVVELKGHRAALLAQAESDGITLEGLCALDEGFAAAEHRFAGYLTARNYDRLRAAADGARDS
jgi:hypothetical protein